MDILAGLNQQQQQAVVVGTGPVLVLAGPGSGKTRVLTHRIAYLVSSLMVRPEQILAVTFTNKAAMEMQKRIMQLLQESAYGLTLGTFHANCARILRREAQHLPFDNNFAIYDTDDQLALIKQSLQDFNVDDKKYRPTSIHASISYAKNELIFPDDFPVQDYRDELIARIYRRYQEYLLTNNALDFDDLLLWTVYLFEHQEMIKQKYAKRFAYILVDEFQDTNLAQYVLLKILASFHRNLYVVGDIDQSIYRWRGADYRNVFNFEQDFPDAQTILLEQNYRSTQSILDVATAVINRHPHRTPKRLFTDRGFGEKVSLRELFDDREEAEFVVKLIVDSLSKGRYQPRDFAVMYRTNAQSRVLEEAFLHTGVPYKLVGAQRFYGRREIKDIVAYLRLVCNINDEVSLFRIINIPTRGIGNKTVIEMKTAAQTQKMSCGEFLLWLAREENSRKGEVLSNRSILYLTRFAELLLQVRSQVDDLTPLQLMDLILQKVDYRAYIDDDTPEGQERWDNVLELRRLAAEFHERGLQEFLEQVALVSDQDTLAEGNNLPTLLTLHAAKGLEFPFIFITGLNDGILPHSRSFDDPEAMHEERRLFYVGITRAKDHLFLLYSQTRSAFGYSEPVMPSRFLEDIPDALLIASTFSRPVKITSLSDQPNELWQSSRIKDTPIVERRYHPGMQVLHHAWGQGMILNSHVEDNDEIVDIFFEDIGLKRVAASLARLEIRE